MKPTQWLEEIKQYKRDNITDFPLDRFTKSCLIYSKRFYGIFLLEDVNGDYFTVKVKIPDSGENIDNEYAIGLYLKQFAYHIPNLLYPDDIYSGENPVYYELFSRKKLTGSFCKNENITEIFSTKYFNYHYYLTKACDYNLGYYLGKFGGKYSYEAFVGFTFQLLVGLQTLHRLGIYHGDIKPANILICSSEIAKTNRIITYKYGNIKKWNISYDVLGNKDIKIIDYGNSIVVNDMGETFEAFEKEISIALVGIIKLMWTKVTNKIKQDNYEDLIVRLQNVRLQNSDVLDVMLNVPIFADMENGNTGYEIMLLI